MCRLGRVGLGGALGGSLNEIVDNQLVFNNKAIGAGPIVLPVPTFAGAEGVGFDVGGGEVGGERLVAGGAAGGGGGGEFSAAVATEEVGFEGGRDEAGELWCGECGEAWIGEGENGGGAAAVTIGVAGVAALALEEPVFEGILAMFAGTAMAFAGDGNGEWAGCIAFEWKSIVEESGVGGSERAVELEVGVEEAIVEVVVDTLGDFGHHGADGGDSDGDIASPTAKDVSGFNKEQQTA